MDVKVDVVEPVRLAALILVKELVLEHANTAVAEVALSTVVVLAVDSINNKDLIYHL